MRLNFELCALYFVLCAWKVRIRKSQRTKYKEQSTRLRQLVFNNPQVQLIKLFGINFTRIINHQVRGQCCFWKCNHISHVIGAGEHHHQAIDARRNHSMGWRAILERIKEETKSLTRLFSRHAEGFEDKSLNVTTVNANRTTSHLNSIDDRVIGFRSDFAKQFSLAALDSTLQE